MGQHQQLPQLFALAENSRSTEGDQIGKRNAVEDEVKTARFGTSKTSSLTAGARTNSARNDGESSNRSGWASSSQGAGERRGERGGSKEVGATFLRPSEGTGRGGSSSIGGTSSFVDSNKGSLRRGKLETEEDESKGGALGSSALPALGQKINKAKAIFEMESLEKRLEDKVLKKRGAKQSAVIISEKVSFNC